ncbi:exonuclease domain-containing protein [Cytophagales bacterium LB-30]|uniref:Exonuclease domain-containing protein n=1 Tax=Shiella aurantiaca TaxID=3058365 RepID=A0ABT8F1R1_9BACT|nr:exonuclease domain-containing protein [Shiella aurantiaca]MDN4164345.1 exonuclease domain-containing protein [Shiella aurantiaca]
MRSFVSIDFETANQYRQSICSVGITVVEDFQIVDSHEVLIKPTPNYFNSMNVGIHGISENDVLTAPAFDNVWKNHINLIIQDRLVVCHNASFDISALKYALDAYNLLYPTINYLCTYRLSKHLFDNIENYKLSTLSKIFDIPLNHHNAKSDSEACAKLLLKILQQKNYDSVAGLLRDENFELGYLSPHSYSSSKPLPSRIPKLYTKKDNSNNIISDILQGKTFVISGVFENFERDELKELIIQNGGKVLSGISGKLDYLLAGQNMGPAKLEKAQKLGVSLLTESEFMHLINPA